MVTALPTSPSYSEPEAGGSGRTTLMQLCSSTDDEEPGERIQGRAVGRTRVCITETCRVQLEEALSSVVVETFEHRPQRGPFHPFQNGVGAVELLIEHRFITSG